MNVPIHDYSKYLIGDTMQQDESLRGFVARIAHRNESLGLVRGSLQSYYHASCSISMFSSLTGVPSDVLKSHGCYEQKEGSKTGMVRFGGVLLPANQVWQRIRRLCPRCLTEDGISRAYWDLKAYKCCHRHGIRLVSECSDCKRSFTWDSESPDVCACGLLLASVKTNPAIPVIKYGISRLVERSFRQTMKYADSTEIPRSFQKFLFLDWILLLVEFIKYVLIPTFWNERESGKLKLEDHKMDGLVGTMLGDENYRRILREGLFDHASKDPMTMGRALTPGNSLEEIKQLYDGCIEDIPFHPCLWEFYRSMKWLERQRIKTGRRKSRSTKHHAPKSAFLIRQRSAVHGTISKYPTKIELQATV